MQIKEKREKIYIKCGRSDMRRGIDGISCIVAESLGESVLFDESGVFLFYGTKRSL